MFLQISLKRKLLVRVRRATALRMFAVVFTASLLCAFLTAIFPFHAAATTTGTINFQARLETSSGAIAPDNTYNVEFKLYDTANGGSPKWTEDRLISNSQGIKVIDGYLTANLGSVNPFPATIDWSQQLYLTINIGGTGATPAWDGEMSPRVQLTATPYAFQAQSASQLKALQGSNASTLGFANQTAANSILLPDESGTVCLTSGNCVGTGGGIGGSGTSGTIAMFTGTGEIGNSIVTQSGTTIGITGTLQATTVDVNSIQTNGTARIDSSGNLISIGTYTGGGNITTAGGVLSIQGSGINYLAGSLGIGTLSPSQKLDVQGGNINTSGEYMVGGSAVISSAGILQPAALGGTYNQALNFNNLGNVYFGDGSNLINLDASDITLGMLGIAYGGTGSSSVGPAGSIAFSNGSSYAFTSVGNAGQCLESAGVDMPTWDDCSNGVTSVGALDGGIQNPTGAYISSNTLYLQSASTTYAGLVTVGVQSFTGHKTFTSDTTVATDSTDAFRVQGADGTLLLGADTTHKFVGIGNAAPQTLLDVGVGGPVTYNASSHPGPYTCDPGDSLNGTTCTHLSTYTATQHDGYYYCPNGGTLSGTTCTNWTYTASYSPPSTSYGPWSPPSADCTNGGAFYGSIPPDTYDTQYTGTYLNCPAGTPMAGTTGYAIQSRSVYHYSGYYYCPSGGTLSGTTCSGGSYAASYQNTYYTCDAGDVLTGTTCTHATTYPATPGAPIYSCSPPDILDGTVCERTNVSALFEGMVGLGTSNAQPLTYTTLASTPGKLSFGTYTAVSNGGGIDSYYTAVGDFNGDGNPDLVVNNYNNNTISVFLNNGSGGLGSATTYNTSLASPVGVAVGDFNEDGKQDIAVTNYGNSTVTIFSGNGNGTLNITPVTVSVGPNPWGLAVGDFNDDGHPDIAVGDRGAAEISVLTNDGSGNFTNTNITTSYTTWGVTVADFNGDGLSDIAASDYSNSQVTVLTNNGAGISYTATYYAVGSGPYYVATGDFNGDGKPDLVVPNMSSTTISVLINNGTSFQPQKTSSSYYSSPTSVAVADFNGDGYQDLVVGNDNTSSLAVLLGNGDGTFAAGLPFGVGYNYPWSVSATDMNGDGRPDVVTDSYNSGYASVLLNTTIFPIPSVTGSGTLSIIPYTDTSSGIIIQGNAGQTGSLFGIQDTAGNNMFNVGANGNVQVNSLQSYPSSDYTITQPTWPGLTSFSGSSVSLGDDSMSGAINLPFSFKFYGQSYSSIYICANGFITFLTGQTCATYAPSTSTMPNSASPNGLIAGMWRDLNPTGGTITYGTVGSGSNQTFIVYFNGVYVYGTTTPVTFQIKLNESDNSIEIDTVTSGSATNGTQGIENATGTAASYVPGRTYTALNLTNDSVLFMPAPDTHMLVNSLTVNTGNTAGGANSTSSILVLGKDATTGRSINAAGSINANGADYAEYFYQADPGSLLVEEVVCLAGSQRVAACGSAKAGGVIVGAVSDRPGFVGNDLYDVKDPRKTALVGMLGQLPVKFSNANGDISVGDPVTYSVAEPGSVVRAVASGQILGYALTTSDGETSGSITVLVRPQAWQPGAERLQGSTALFNEIVVNGALHATDINVSGLATVGSLKVTSGATVGGDLTVSGKTTVANLYVGGQLVLSQHLLSMGARPQISVGAQLGLTTPFIDSVASVQLAQASLDGTDSAGTISFTAGKGAQSGELVAVTFAKSYTRSPRVVISPDSSSALGLGLYVAKTVDDTGLPTGFKLMSTVAPTPGVTYHYDYIILAAQPVTREQ